MKLLHLGDLHFGKTVNGFSMIEDQKYIVEQIYKLILDEHIEAVLMAGDIYDRSIPGGEAVTLFDEFLTRLKLLHVSVCLISGNHDSAERLNFASRLLESENIFVACNLEKQIKKVTLFDEYGPLNIYMLPFIKPLTVRAYFNDDTIHTFDDAVRRCIANTPIDLNERNVIMTHHFVVSGNERPELSDSEITLSVGGIDEVRADCFKSFDYTALGHIHRPQKIGNDMIRYAGSLLKYSFSECHTDKVMTVIDMKEKGNISINLFKLTPLRDMRKIKGKLNDLINENILTLENREDYIHVTLTDHEALIEPMNTLRSIYPNVMQLTFDRNAEHEKQASEPKQMSTKSINKLFDDFYEYVTGQPLNDEETAVIREVIDEAEKVNA